MRNALLKGAGALLLAFIFAKTSSTSAQQIFKPWGCDSKTCTCIQCETNSTSGSCIIDGACANVQHHNCHQSQVFCDQNCCQSYACDPRTRSCVNVGTGGGGFNKADCESSCNDEMLGYNCVVDSTSPTGATCAPNKDYPFPQGFKTKTYCDIQCGSNAVSLCAYTCGQGDKEYMFSMCNARLVDGATLNCPGQFQAMSLRAPTHDSGLAAPACLADYQTSFFKNIPCCNPRSTFDITHIQCKPPGGQPPDYHEPSPTCPDGTNATWFSRTEMQGGLRQCEQYACDWGAPWGSLASETCPSDVCANPTWLSIPMCTAGASRNEAHRKFKRLPAKQPPQNRSTFYDLVRTASSVVNGTVNGSVSFRNSAGRYFNLQLHAQLVEDPILYLDEQQAVGAVGCNPSGIIQVHLDGRALESEFLNSLEAAKFITGGAHWGCAFEDSHADSKQVSRKSIVRRIETFSVDRSASPTIVQLVTTPASPLQLLRNAKMSMHTDMLHEKQLHLHAASNGHHKQAFDAYVAGSRQHWMAHLPVSGGKRKLLWGSFGRSISNGLSSVWNGVKQLPAKVEGAVAGVVHTLKALFTGDYNANQDQSLASFNWNYDASTGGALQKNLVIDDSVTCTDCYSHMDLSLHVDLEISNYALTNVAAYFHGVVAHHVDFTGEAQQSYNSEYDKTVGIIQLPDVTFTIGVVPFLIQSTIPVHIGYTTNLFSDTGKVEASAKMDADAKYGVQWTPAAGFQFIHTHTQSYSGSVSVTDAQLKVVATAYVMPVFVITVDHLGGVTVGLKGSATATVLFKEDGSLCSPSGGAGTQVSAAWGLQLTIGAQLLVAFAGYTFVNKKTDQQIIWSHQWPLYSACLQVPGVAEAPQDDSYSVFESVQWVGPVKITQAPECDGFLSIQAGMQFVNQSENGYLGFVGVALHNFQRDAKVDVPFNIGCVGQRMYVADGGTLQRYAQPAVEPDVSYENCTLNATYTEAGVTISNLEGTWTFSEDLGTLIIQPSNRCIQGPIALNRERKTPKFTALGEGRVGGDKKWDLIWDGHPGGVATHEAYSLNQTKLLSSAQAIRVLNGYYP